MFVFELKMGGIGEKGPSISLRVEQSSIFRLKMGIWGGAFGHLVFGKDGDIWR